MTSDIHLPNDTKFNIEKNSLSELPELSEITEGNKEYHISLNSLPDNVRAELENIRVSASNELNFYTHLSPFNIKYFLENEKGLGSKPHVEITKKGLFGKEENSLVVVQERNGKTILAFYAPEKTDVFRVKVDWENNKVNIDGNKKTKRDGARIQFLEESWTKLKKHPEELFAECNRLISSSVVREIRK